MIQRTSFLLERLQTLQTIRRRYQFRITFFFKGQRRGPTQNHLIETTTRLQIQPRTPINRQFGEFYGNWTCYDDNDTSIAQIIIPFSAMHSASSEAFSNAFSTL